MWFSVFSSAKSCFLLWIGIIGFLIRAIHCRKGWLDWSRTDGSHLRLVMMHRMKQLRALINFQKAWRGSKCEISQVLTLGRGWKWCQRPRPPDIMGFFEWIVEKACAPAVTLLMTYSPHREQWELRKATEERTAATQSSTKARRGGTRRTLRTDSDTSIRLFVPRSELYGSYRMHNYLFHCLAKHLINRFFMCSAFVTSEARRKTNKSNTSTRCACNYHTGRFWKRKWSLMNHPIILLSQFFLALLCVKW